MFVRLLMFWYCSPLGSLPSDRIRILHDSGGCGFLFSKELRSHQLWTGEPSAGRNNREVRGGTTTKSKIAVFFLTATRSLGLWVYSVGFYGSIFYTGKLQRFWTFEFGIPYDYEDSRANKSKRPHILYTVGAKTYQPR